MLRSPRLLELSESRFVEADHVTAGPSLVQGEARHQDRHRSFVAGGGLTLLITLLVHPVH
jgi:hypothetical protein